MLLRHVQDRADGVQPGGGHEAGECSALAYPAVHRRSLLSRRSEGTMRVELIGHVKSCMTEIYLHIAARMAD